LDTSDLSPGADPDRETVWKENENCGKVHESGSPTLAPVPVRPTATEITALPTRSTNALMLTCKARFSFAAITRTGKRTAFPTIYSILSAAFLTIHADTRTAIPSELAAEKSHPWILA